MVKTTANIKGVAFAIKHDLKRCTISASMRGNSFTTTLDSAYIEEVVAWMIDPSDKMPEAIRYTLKSLKELIAYALTKLDESFTV